MSRATNKIVPLHAEGVVNDRIEIPLVSPGTYTARYKRHETFRAFGSAEKLAVYFTIDEPGEAWGLTFPRFWNVKLTKRGFTVGKRSSFLRDFCRLFPDFRPRRKDRIPVKMFAGRQVLVKVVTVVQSEKRKPIPEALQYSKIAEILEVL